MTATLQTTSHQDAARYTRLLAACLDITPDVEEAMAAAEVAMEWDREQSQISGQFAHDIANRKAQGLLNKAMDAAKRLSRKARDELAVILESSTVADVLSLLESWLSKYRVRLTNLLTTTQLAALLEGMREVAKSVRRVPVFPASAMPPTLSHARTTDIVERLAPLVELEREQLLYAMPVDEAAFIRDMIVAEGQASEPPSFVPSPPVYVEGESFTAEQPGDVHLVFIDEAAKELARKNVLVKEEFDRLDAACRQKAFTIAGVDSEATIMKVRDALAEVVREGPDLEAFRAKVLARVDSGTFLSDTHLEMVFRGAVQSALSDGKLAVIYHPFIRSGFPFATINPIDDDRVRPEHLALETMGLDGTNVYRIEDPVWQTFRGPWGFGCRCGWMVMTIRQAAEAGVKEAIEWLKTGIEPTPPARVPWPDFRPDPAFQRSLLDQPVAVQLSMQPVGTFAVNFEESKHPRGQPKNQGQFSKGHGTPDNSAKPPAMGRLVSLGPSKPAAADQGIGKPQVGKLVSVSGKEKRLAPNLQQATPAHLDAAAFVMSALDARTSMADETKRVYADHAWSVLSRMSDGELKRFRKGCDHIVFHENMEQLNASVKSFYQLHGKEFDRKAGGVYYGAFKVVAVDGGGLGYAEAREIYAHEFMHAIDGPKHEISSSQEWQQAWSQEINHPSWPISSYATSKPSEGLAEFGRLLFSSPFSRQTLEKQFPACYAALKKYGVG